MGGAKCSYKNCTVRSARGVHLFHYPVLDRARCHKWLINAHRQDFLNLKVSQLKNRMICQYHFAPDDFMNDAMEKLNATAIPTLDGPYCDVEKLHSTNDKQESFDSFMLEEIENLTYPRKYIEKDMYSKRYSSFLTDCDILDGDLFKDDNPISSKVELENPEDQVKVPFAILKATKRKDRKKVPPKPKTDLQPSTEKSCVQYSAKPEEIPIEFETPKLYKKDANYKATKIQILSEEKIFELDPVVPLFGHFEPVKPDTILPLPNKTKKKNYSFQSTLTSSADIIDKQEGNKTQLLNYSYDNSEHLNIQAQTQVQEEVNSSFETPSIINKSLLKNNYQNKNIDEPKLSLVKPGRTIKLDPERVSAIQEKRNFNKKLRDMISFNIDVTDLSPKKSTSNKDHKGNLLNEEQSIVGQIIAQRTPEKDDSKNCIKSHLAEDKSLPSVQEYAFSALEARINRMEELLLSKIEHNTQIIVSLKKSIDKSVRNSFTVSTQTESEEKSHKKYLFKEISKYLSANANSLIFEELFIDTHVADIPKRRKLR